MVIYEMGDIQKLAEIDFLGWIITGFMIMAAVIAMYTIVCKFCEMLGKPIGVLKQRKLDHELTLQNAQAIKELSAKHEEDTKQSIRHDEMIREDLKTLTNTVNTLADRFEKMQKKNNETKVKELKDTLITYYNKYRVIGEWSKLEKDAFWELFEDYESRGGDGYIHSIVEPVMRELKEID